jgi:cystathionine beta-lyase/cystathionine gamma-synthase
LRILINIYASLAISHDFQSPSFSHSLTSMAGRQTGQIKGNINDYKRDVHLDSYEYEKIFLKEFIDAKFKFALRSFLVNSGMSAFSTILTYLQSIGKLNGKILLGKNVYFQNKQLICKMFGDQVIEVEENNLLEIKEIITKTKPCVIYFDSLCNSPDINKPDLTSIIDLLNKNCRIRTYLLIDNTLMSVYFQPFKLVRRPGNLKIISFESLNKYHQYGLDRVTAGIITCQFSDSAGLYEYRKHCGSILTDFSTHLLPTPNRQFFEKRLQKLSENVQYLSSRINKISKSARNFNIDQIIYPKSSKSWDKKMSFSGSFFNIRLKKSKQNPKNINNLINKVINLAQKRKVNIIAGTSFGFNTTRIYLTASHTAFAQSFLRIAVGTENKYRLNQIAEIISLALE